MSSHVLFSLSEDEAPTDWDQVVFSSRYYLLFYQIFFSKTSNIRILSGDYIARDFSDEVWSAQEQVTCFWMD